MRAPHAHTFARKGPLVSRSLRSPPFGDGLTGEARAEARMRTLQIWPTKRAYIFIYICAADLHPNCGVRAVARFSASDSSEGTREPRGSKGSRCKGMVGGEIKTVRVGAGVEAGHGDGAGSTCGSGRSGRFNGQVSEGRRTGPKMSARCRTLRRGAHPYRASRERLST